MIIYKSPSKYQVFIQYLVYLFAFSLCFERLTMFGYNMDFQITKISSFLFIFFSFFDLKFWTTLKKYRQYVILLIFYFIILTISSYVNRSAAYLEYFDYLFFLNIMLFLMLGSVFYRNKSCVLNSLLVFAFGNICLTILYFLGIGHTESSLELEGRASIFGNNQNYLGLSLSISSLVIIYSLLYVRVNKFKIFFYVVSLAFLVYFMILTGSRTAFLSFFIGLLLLIALSNKISKTKKVSWFIFLAISLFVTWLLFLDQLDLLKRLSDTFQYGDSASRDIIWSTILYFFSDHIIFGVGKTGYLRIIGDISPHNAFLEVFIYTGLFGLSIFVIFLQRLFVNILKLYKKTSDFLPLIIFIAVLGILVTGQLFDQKVVWFFMACFIQNPKAYE